MSSRTWTPAALSSSAHPAEGVGWRLVESQHQVSTMKLVDTLAEQALLEELIDTVKPPLPEAALGLHYLLATPFRYRAEYTHGSRFRRSGRTQGVCYAAENVETAVAEMAFYRVLLYVESPEIPWPVNAAEFTAFAAAYRTGRAVDLGAPPFDVHRDVWEAPCDYAACQDFASAARKAGIELIRYASVRDPEHRANLAILAPSAFSDPEPVGRQTWKIYLHAHGVWANREFPAARLEFPRGAFAADPRIATLRWDR